MILLKSQANVYFDDNHRGDLPKKDEFDLEIKLWEQVWFFMSANQRLASTLLLW